MDIIAHRGASRRAPENTLAAFRPAWELGADGVETDVHLSRDGVPVAVHSESVLRTTAVHSLTTNRPGWLRTELGL